MPSPDLGWARSFSALARTGYLFCQNRAATVLVARSPAPDRSIDSTNTLMIYLEHRGLRLISSVGYMLRQVRRAVCWLFTHHRHSQQDKRPLAIQQSKNLGSIHTYPLDQPNQISETYTLNHARLITPLHSPRLHAIFCKAAALTTAPPPLYVEP